MPAHRDPTTPSPSADGGGVRVSTHSGEGRGAWRHALPWLAVAAIAVCAGLGYLLMSSTQGGSDSAAPSVVQVAADVDDGDPDAPGAMAPAASAKPRAAVPAGTAHRGEGLSLDLADYIDPSKPVPSTAEIIRTLNEAGIHSGIGAFNPPGTSPPMVGLAVPEDVPLPEGYVRHYQTTDDGQDIEPILMFSPDYEFFDAAGRPIPIPENRVVPPDMAPPGLPGRRIDIPPPREGGGG